MVTERFSDTWTKMRVFEVLDVEREGGKKRRIESLCFLDAGMLVLADPTPLIFSKENLEYLQDDADGEEEEKEQGKRLCATHVCVCNLDADAWAPHSWRTENSAFMPLTSSE